MKYWRAMIASTLFMVVLVLVYYAHVNLFKINVVFYAAIADGLIAVVVAGLGLWFFKYFSLFSNFERLLLVLICLLLGYSAAISVPTVIDRSLSFYILEKLQQRGGGIRQDSFEQIFVQEYMKEHRLVDVRLTEQMESGTIVIKNGCVLLTKKGERIATFGRYFRKNWLPKQRLLLGEYSNDLTDPFRNVEGTYSYTCDIDKSGNGND